jgi:hypothetical protein
MVSFPDTHLNKEDIDLVAFHKHPGEGGEEEEVEADGDPHAEGGVCTRSKSYFSLLGFNNIS